MAETAEACGYEKISFLDDHSETAIGKIGELQRFVKDYEFAFVGIGNNRLRGELQDWLEKAGYNLMPGCIVEPRAVVGCGSTIGQATVIGANVVVEPYCFIGDSCTLKSGTIVKSTSMVAMNTSTEQGSVLFTSLTKE